MACNADLEWREIGLNLNIPPTKFVFTNLSKGINYGLGKGRERMVRMLGKVEERDDEWSV